ncbi:hypothetical protein AVL62_13815 [Serinicoccus chungangensis]|uniref:Uncharacterized protein n=1 Tax=Serinicoccus chungangensis TaxID=767452 RepID=A0A0W8I3J6_9MICO|nr:hypothetical protein [Serinicoccus chungangensis]KUG52410.1 hypothetical protein AVL62_13815 [Serinicoccus chungangensis]
MSNRSKLWGAATVGCFVVLLAAILVQQRWLAIVAMVPFLPLAGMAGWTAEVDRRQQVKRSS